MKLFVNQERLLFTGFTDLCSEFAKADPLISKQHKDMFLQVPLKKWVEKLHEIQSTAHVKDAQSVSHYIKLFNQQHGETVKEMDMREDPVNKLIKVTLDEAPNMPNNLQLAVS